MRKIEAARALAGGFVVYVVMAACTGSQRYGAPVEARDDGGAGGANARNLGEHDGADEGLEASPDSVLDGLTNPVEEAHAEGTPDSATGPTVMTADCITPSRISGNGSFFAVANFPGKSTTDLARLSAVYSTTTTLPQGWYSPDGFDSALTTVYVRDGSAAAYCYAPTGRVTFVLP